MELAYESLLQKESKIAQIFKLKLRDKCFNCYEIDAAYYDYQRSQVICQICYRKTKSTTVVNLTSFNFNIKAQKKSLSTTQQRKSLYENIIKESEIFQLQFHKFLQQAKQQLLQVRKEIQDQTQNITIINQIVNGKVALQKAESKAEKVNALRILFQIKQKIGLAQKEKQRFVKKLEKKGQNLISLLRGWAVELKNTDLRSRVLKIPTIPEPTIIQYIKPVPQTKKPATIDLGEFSMKSDIKNNFLSLEGENWEILCRQLRQYRQNSYTSATLLQKSRQLTSQNQLVQQQVNTGKNMTRQFNNEIVKVQQALQKISLMNFCIQLDSDTFLYSRSQSFTSFTNGYDLDCINALKQLNRLQLITLFLVNSFEPILLQNHYFTADVLKECARYTRAIVAEWIGMDSSQVIRNIDVGRLFIN